MKIIKSLLLLPLAVVVIVLSVANRHAIVFNMAPLPYEIEIPLYLLMLAVFLVGLLVGGGAVVVAGLRRWQRRSSKAHTAPISAGLDAGTGIEKRPEDSPKKFPISLNLRRKPGYMEDI